MSKQKSYFKGNQSDTECVSLTFNGPKSSLQTFLQHNCEEL